MRVVRDIPVALDELVMALLRMDAMKRRASAAEVIDRLSAAGELEADNEAATARRFLAGSQLIGRDAQRFPGTRRIGFGPQSNLGGAAARAADQGASRPRRRA
jgi:hypothetical protein